MRSLLFVPGDSEKKLEKGLGSGADVLLIDLEDSVARDRKPAAREITAAFLGANAGRGEGPRLFVRVNALDTGLTDADLDAVVGAGAAGVMLPKSLAGRDVTHLDAKLAVREAEAGRAEGSVAILAIATEAAAAVFTLASYAGASRRLGGLAWGAEDLSADVGSLATRGADGRWTAPYALARQLTLFGAVAAGVAPIDTVYTDFRNEAGLAAECAEAARDGFTAKMAIHPAQVPVINAAFTPSPEAIAEAEAIVAAFAGRDDLGVVGVGGKMLDRPHLRRAEALLARIGR